MRSRRAVPALLDDGSPEPARWPRVSLIVAARDEEQDFERAVPTRLADDYPDLEVILVDDRSTDRTSEIADRLAREDARVKVIHVAELPEGWLGIVHAMQRGLSEIPRFEVTANTWLLVSDADVELAPGTLRRAIAAMR